MPNVPALMVANGLDVGLVCDDNEAMHRFYGETLGFEESLRFPIDDTREMAMFAYGDSTLKLQLLKTPPPKHRGGIDQACGYRLLTIDVASIAEVSDRNVAAGRKPISSNSLTELGFPPPPGADPDAVRIGFASDPDGNLVELVEGTGRTGLNAVGLTVSNAEEATRFWVDILGGADGGTAPIIPPLEKRDVSFKGTVVKFWQYDESLPKMTGPITDHVGIRYITAGVSDIEATYDGLVAAGATPDQPPREFMAGFTVAFLRDPDGNIVELLGS